MSHYVFFSGLPKSYPQQGIRDLFSRCGNVVSLRISAPKSSSSSSSGPSSVSDSITQSGLIEYADEASQQAAIALFNGYVIETPRGSVRIRVGASSGFNSSAVSGKIRGRDHHHHHHHSGAPGNGIENSAGATTGQYKHEKFVDSDLSTSEHLLYQFEQKQQLGYIPSRRSTFDPLQASLIRAPDYELREAVEQLRVLCAEQPERAKMLLETFPQLRRAVCLILQKDEKLPIPLPPEAFIERQQQQQQQQQVSDGSAKKNSDEKRLQDGQNVQEDEAASSNNNNNNLDNIDPVEQEQIQNIINELSPEALAEMLSADFDSQEGQMEESVRQHFIKIQKQLRAMTEE